ncbi:DNA-methyltransferase Dcm [Bradyrhizobium sp. YR681]|uniref:DNA cytosine methyltransferase n=1 Tax=Bradyrhizobium sp. YR681 TaxID=1144344 RepID=UPI00026F7453|nr:DNA cytosine methyltransferase [Bradyrhizobium sp. YR681]EJN10761.1 DNA-methyltransferase Dcm [Bradyrhizobium sp. YR681]
MSVVGLFSGIGGFELAFARAGFKTSLMAEIEPAASAVLRERFPEIELRGDVATLGKLPEDADIMTAGFPCQNLSMAGDKSGIAGTKSGVVEKMFDLIETSHIQTVVIENVYFMLQLDRGNGMRWLADRFEALGYKWAYRILNSAAFGLPQRRRRVYMIASRTIDPRSVLFADEHGAPAQEEPTLSKPLGFYWTEGRSGIGLTVDGIPPLKVGSALGIPSAPAVLFPDGEVLTPGLGACEALQGFPKGWTDIELNHSRRPEWRMLGNAISVPVAEWIAKRIVHPGDVLNFRQEKIVSGKWPSAAWNVAGERIAVIASDWPVALPPRSIAEFRNGDWSRLSDRALDGFIERVLAGGLRVPAGFIEALRAADRKVRKAA